MPGRRYPDHECACQHCHPEQFPSRERQGEGHVAIHFNTRDWECSVYLDGDELRDCIEAIAGEDGLVVRVRQPAHQCCSRRHGEPNSGVCSYVQRGHVRVTRPIADTESH